MTHKAKIAVLTLFASLMAFAAIGQAQPAAPPGGMIYANDQTYRTVGTPTNLPDHGKFDTIYVLGGSLANVADAAPGDHDWNGGRWAVRLVTFMTISPTQFTNAADVLAAEGRGEISIGGVVKRFECPLIPMRN